ncbi:MAG: hypothetical protein HY292_26980 [Planctomycetes bacterium]|nr:hypothetical protein [Planctomycetota bacterium]
MNEGFTARHPAMGEVAPSLRLCDLDGNVRTTESLFAEKRFLVLDFVNYT